MHMPTHLSVCKLAVLQVVFSQGPNTGIGVVVGILTHTVWETLLEQRTTREIFCIPPRHRAALQWDYCLYYRNNVQYLKSQATAGGG